MIPIPKAGFYDQHEQWFRDEAEGLAINLLETGLDAEINAITRVIDRELHWLRRSDQTIIVEIGKARIDVSSLGIERPKLTTHLLAECQCQNSKTAETGL